MFKRTKAIVHFSFNIIIINLIFISGINAATIYVSTYGDGTCAAANVKTAINAASNGDTVIVPAGSCEWTTSNSVSINKSITLQGNGIDSTIITVHGSDYQGVVGITAANATVKGFTFTQKDASKPYAVQVTAGGNFRITGNNFTGTTGYAIDIRNVYGVIDNNKITFTNGSSQPINVRGPSNSWQTDSTIGGADNVFLEDNEFTATNVGYPTCSTNSRCVIRYNTFGPTKMDIHGTCTGNPGARHYEIYNNTWGDYAGYYTAIEIRGGTGRIFNNVGIKTSGALWFTLDEHACNHTYCAGYAPNCCCEAPCDGQIGVGKDPKVRASEPLYIWGNTKNGDYWASFIITNVSLCATEEQCGAGFNMAGVLTENLDFFDSETKPVAMDGYTAYIYPHPLRNETSSPPPSTPIVSVTPETENFGIIKVDSQSIASIFTVANAANSSGNLTIKTVAVSGSDYDQFSIQNDTCSGITVTPGQNCTFNAIFLPKSGGAKSANIVLTDTNDATIKTIPVTGTGELPPLIGLEYP